jgi:hypothetical protein
MLLSLFLFVVIVFIYSFISEKVEDKKINDVYLKTIQIGVEGYLKEMLIDPKTGKEYLVSEYERINKEILSVLKKYK